MLMYQTLDLQQVSISGMCEVTLAVEAMAASGGVEERGAIFTRREVVDFILDMTGYTAEKPLHKMRLLEPSFGGGDFLLPALTRLLQSWVRSGRSDRPVEALAGSVRAVELHRESFIRTRMAVCDLLTEFAIDSDAAVVIADAWLIHGDFLLTRLPNTFDVVVGNPPYVRQELIPAPLLAEYRSRYATLYDRADLYVPFIERSLTALAPGGVLGFICADRWMKNRYGGPLRAMVASGFNLRVYVDMVDTPAFHSEVMAYPAITIIAREAKGATRIAHRPAIERAALAELALDLTAPHFAASGGRVRELVSVTSGSEPWILESSEQMALVRRLERDFPTLEDAGCKVGIGVATGADDAFIGPFDALEVEPDRKLPLVTTRDVVSGEVRWRGLGVVNPFLDTGGLVCLGDFPKLAAYLEARRDQIIKRHVAQKTPANWYRTIDRITPSLAGRPKLLIPDIKGEANIVYESGKLYPHHNLYFIASDEWDLHALQAVLLSGIARLFVATYSTKMRGGYLRFQAQYLRRIRVPQWQDVPAALRPALIAAGRSRDREECNRVAFALYSMNATERATLEGNGD
jgi:hypothetical protein